MCGRTSAGAASAGACSPRSRRRARQRPPAAAARNRHPQHRGARALPPRRLCRMRAVRRLRAGPAERVHGKACKHLIGESRESHAGQSQLQRTEEGRRGGHDRHRDRRHGGHAGPPRRQALPGRVLRRRRARGDARLRLPARRRHRHGAGAGLRGGELGQGLWRLRHEARHDDLAPPAVARGHRAGARRRARSSPRRRAAFAARDAEGARSRG